MRELGIDLADRAPRLLTRELAERADVVVTMGCGDSCPYIPGKRYVDWDLPDPKGQPLETVRATRDEIARRVRALAEELDRAYNLFQNDWRSAGTVRLALILKQVLRPAAGIGSARVRVPCRRRRTAGALVLAPAAHANLPSSIETTVVPGGNAAIASPTLPADMKSANVDAVPISTSDAQFFQNMELVLSLQPSPGKRLLMCIGLYINVAHGIDETAELQFPETVHPLAVLLLSACLEQAAQIDRARQQAGATAAARQCRKLATQVGATFTRVGRNYRATIDGTPTKLKQRGRLKVSCKPLGAGLTLKVRPTSAAPRCAASSARACASASTTRWRPAARDA